MAAAVVLVVVLAGCSQASSSWVGSPNSRQFRAGSVQVVPSGRRKFPVVMAGTTLEGKRLDLALLRGRPVVLNVWGSWCSPCRAEAAELSNAYQKLHPQGVAFVGIDVHDSKAEAIAFEHRYHIDYPSLVDEGALILALRGAASPNAIPITLVLDEKGRIAGRIVGGVHAASLIDMVRTIGRSQTG
jgi:thiol-disulfide isomerase/thioredoxin